MAVRTNLYIGTDRGLWVCRRGDASENWYAIRRTLENRMVLQILPQAGSPGHMAVLSRGDGVFYSRDGGQEWVLTLPAVATCLLSDPQDATRIYAGMSARRVQSGVAQLGPVMVSADGGQVWHALAPLPGAADTTAVLTLAMARMPADEAVLWAGLSTGGVVATYDQGASWQWRRIGLDLSAPVRHLALLRARYPGLYAVGSSGIYYLELRQALAGPLGATVVWRHRYPTTADDAAPGGPALPTYLLALGKGVAGGVLLTTDAQGLLWHSDQQATSWRRLNNGATGLPSHEAVTTVVPNPFHADSVFLGTASGQVYESTDRGAQWRSLGFDAGAPVRTLALARA
jgi:photosystem II stability/assembly factor-like uncharacterized protein